MATRFPDKMNVNRWNVIHWAENVAGSLIQTDYCWAIKIHRVGMVMRLIICIYCDKNMKKVSPYSGPNGRFVRFACALFRCLHNAPMKITLLISKCWFYCVINISHEKIHFIHCGWMADFGLLSIQIARKSNFTANVLIAGVPDGVRTNVQTNHSPEWNILEEIAMKCGGK